MVLDSLLAGVMLFSSFAVRTPNVEPNPDDYEFSFGVGHENFYFNRQWERELGEKYIDDLFWIKFDNRYYIKPEYMNKESIYISFFCSSLASRPPGRAHTVPWIQENSDFIY